MKGNENLLLIVQENLINPVKKKFISLEKRNHDLQLAKGFLYKQNKILKIWLVIITTICIVNSGLILFLTCK